MFIYFPSHYVSVSAVFPCFSTFLVTPQCIYCFCLPQSFVGAPVNPPMCLCVPGLDFSWLGPRLVWFYCFVQVWLSAKTKGTFFVKSSPAPITFVHKKQNTQKNLYAYNCINKYFFFIIFQGLFCWGGVPWWHGKLVLGEVSFKAIQKPLWEDDQANCLPESEDEGDNSLSAGVRSLNQ